MSRREQWFDQERTKAKKYEIARNIAGVALIGFVGVEVGSDLITHTTLLPDHNIVESLFVGGAHGLAAGIVKTLHNRKRESESSALRAAAYEVDEIEFIGKDYKPADWAVSALADAHLDANEVIKLPLSSIIKPKRVS